MRAHLHTCSAPAGTKRAPPKTSRALLRCEPVSGPCSRGRAISMLRGTPRNCIAFRPAACGTGLERFMKKQDLSLAGKRRNMTSFDKALREHYAREMLSDEVLTSVITKVRGQDAQQRRRQRRAGISDHRSPLLPCVHRRSSNGAPPALRVRPQRLQPPPLAQLDTRAPPHPRLEARPHQRVAAGAAESHAAARRALHAAAAPHHPLRHGRGAGRGGAGAAAAAAPAPGVSV